MPRTIAVLLLIAGLISLVVIRFKDVVTQRVNRGYKLTSNHTRFGSSLITPQRSDNCFTSQRPQPPAPSGEDSGSSDGSKPGPSSAISTRMRRSERSTANPMVSPGASPACRTEFVTTSLVSSRRSSIRC